MPKKNQNKSETQQTQPQQTQQAEPAQAEPQEVPRGDRGELGVATPALTIKQMWHDAHHVLQDVGDKHNPRKQLWVKRAGAPSLKKYARDLAKSGNDVAKAWFSNKVGELNAKRSEKNTGRISLEKQASKAARRKKSQGKAAKATADTTTAAVATATVTKGGKGR